MSQPTLRQNLAEFQQLVDWFGQEDVDVDAATKKYQRGAQLAETIRQQLDAAKTQVEVLDKQFDD